MPSPTWNTGKDTTYVAFRNANGHARPGPVEVQGKIIVMRSQDLDQWEICRISTNGDDRDPALLDMGDEIWVAGKTITAQFPSSVEIPPEPSPEKITSLTHQDARLAKTPQDWHTAIWRLVGGHLEPILVFPSRGDCGYPGLVVEKNRVLMSYYSQHDVDEGPEPKPGECANEIYLAEIVM